MLVIFDVNLILIYSKLKELFGGCFMLDRLKEEMKKDYYKKLVLFLKKEYEKHTIYPPREEVFNAFRLTPYENIKVVILGQDPYHNGVAHGLAFSVKHGVEIPPSLKNIFLELKNDCNCYIPNHGCLEKWAKQGVLLLNTVLTVRAGIPNSHKGIGWEIFTDEVIKIINDKETPVVFILWGSHAKAKKKLITNKKHLVLQSAHPSPMAAYYGFFGSRPFSATNDFLIKNGMEPIDWQIDNI